MAKRRSKKLLEADRFRARVVSLLQVRHSDWSEREFDWLKDEAQRLDDYIYTDKERIFLNRLIACTATFTSYSEWSIKDMMDILYPYRKHLDEEGEEFVEKIHRWGATALKVRQINYLAQLCRITEDLPRDSAVAEAMRATRGRCLLYTSPSPRD